MQFVASKYKPSLLTSALAISLVLLTACATKHGVRPPEPACPSPPIPAEKPAALMGPLPELRPPTSLVGLSPEAQAKAATNDYVHAVEAVGTCRLSRQGLIDYIKRED